MSGVHHTTVAAATAATGAVAGHAAHAVLPFTGAAVGLYAFFGFGLMAVGFLVRRIGAHSN